MPFDRGCARVVQRERNQQVRVDEDRSSAARFEVVAALTHERDRIDRRPTGPELGKGVQRRAEIAVRALTEVRADQLVDERVGLDAAPLGLAHDEVVSIRLKLDRARAGQHDHKCMVAAAPCDWALVSELAEIARDRH